jgi:hypothetical protein
MLADWEETQMRIKAESPCVRVENRYWREPLIQQASVEAKSEHEL